MAVPMALSAAGSIMGMLSGNEEEAQPQQTGYNTLAPEFQNTYQMYNNQLQKLYGQGANNRLNPADYIAQLGPSYLNILDQMGRGVNDDWQKYMNPYLGNVFNEIDRNTALGNANYDANNAMANDLGGFYSSSRQNAMQGMQGENLRQKGLAQFNAYNAAQTSRHNYLEEALKARELHRAMEQQNLNLNNPFMRNQQFMGALQGINPLLGGSVGATPATSSMGQKVGAFLQGFGGNMAQSPYVGVDIGNQMPWLNR